MRSLTSGEVGLLAAPLMAAIFVAYVWIAGRLVRRTSSAEVHGLASGSEWKAA